jgi:hypothetical protein
MSSWWTSKSLWSYNLLPLLCGLWLVFIATGGFNSKSLNSICLHKIGRLVDEFAIGSVCPEFDGFKSLSILYIQITYIFCTPLVRWIHNKTQLNFMILQTNLAIGSTNFMGIMNQVHYMENQYNLKFQPISLMLWTNFMIWYPYSQLHKIKFMKCINIFHKGIILNKLLFMHN